MKRSTLIVLALLVGGLLWMQRQADEELTTGGRVTIQKPLLPGMRRDAVSRIRIEHLERGVQLLLERSQAGAWYLSEPVAYPAESALVQTLLDYLHDAIGPVVVDPDLEDLALAPPRAILELTQTVEGGEPQRFRVELGAIDLDARRVHARVPGHPDAPAGGALVTRVLRSIETTLDRNPDDYRLRSCTTIPYSRVSELLRADDGSGSFGFEVLADGGSWRRRDEPRVSLDPAGIGIVLRALTSLRVMRFVNDAPTDVSAYGLDDPRLQFELRAADGRRELLVLSTNAAERDLPPEQARWYVQRDGFPHVWEVRADDVVLLQIPLETLYDYTIVRAAEEDVVALELRRGEAAGLLLESVEGTWWVEDLGSESLVRRRADPDRVGNLIAVLRQAQLGVYAPPEEFRPAEEPRSLVVRTRQGDVLEAELGASWLDVESGVEGPLLRRSGESIAATLSPEVVALWDETLETLEDRLVFAVDEYDVDRIEVRFGDLRHVYRRQDRLWSIGERGRVDGERAVLLERLLRFEAEAWLGPTGPALVDPVTFGFSGRDARAFTLGRLPSGELVIDTGDRRARLREDPLQGDLHAAWRDTFR